MHTPIKIYYMLLKFCKYIIYLHCTELSVCRLKNIDYRINYPIANFPAEKVISLFQKRICNATFLWVTDLTYTHTSRVLEATT